ncbi:23S rRNA (uracil(747)-C(5))-methyltransferase RlmC [Paraoerskovia marina]|uniref:23S rRNA (uracil(747)-C(5))-methyltransferase RlmC n=1 Tax=Paraoerskovia marina TaxID=545619 RepID=UPI0006932225|nr:23S rRNA (uracil(747)-C(5))-methyltransferase RlmC [Paraoerskovia marina]
MHCAYYVAGRCRSCTLIEQPYAGQLDDTQRRTAETLGARPGLRWEPPRASAEAGFRNKGKIVVGGSVQEPTLGILDADGHGVDLQDCGLYVPAIHDALPVLAEFVTRARLDPYDVPARRGELKFVLVTASPDGQLMLRFVLRSQEPVARIRKHLPWLQAALPGLHVASVNLLPEHKAVTEGEREILLTEAETLRMRLDVDLHLRVRSFFQTNTDVAQALYRAAREWTDDVAPARVWDLYCGVGGFALHLAGAGREVTGVEISADAIESARRSAQDAALAGVDFEASDAGAWATTRLAAAEGGSTTRPDLVVVNPPRRGIGELAPALEHSDVPYVLYSSCNPTSLARDLDAMPSLRPVRAQVFDMFPHTAHAEVLTLLRRTEDAGGAPDTPAHGQWSGA